MSEPKDTDHVKPASRRARRWFKANWWNIAKGIILVGAPFLALWQQRTNLSINRINTTHAFVSEFETRDFVNSYRRARIWLEENRPARTWPSDEGIATDIHYILSRYQTLAVFYRKGLLDRTTIEATVGASLPAFYALVEPLLDAKKVSGYYEVAAFAATVQKTLTDEKKRRR